MMRPTAAARGIRDGLRDLEDLLVTGLDLLEADSSAFVLLPEPTGERLAVELEGSHGPEA